MTDFYYFDEGGLLNFDSYEHRTPFATSSAREEAGPSTLRHKTPSVVGSSLGHTRQPPARTEPAYIERWHGVFTDGVHRRYTADAPEVQAYLTDARDTLELPPIDCPIVYSLAAMAVHNKPLDPAHWLFWSESQFAKSLELIQMVSRACNYYFFPSDQWTLEKQRRIKGLYQTDKFYDETALKATPWYPILVPQPEPETRRTTRSGVERQRQTEVERARAKESLVKRSARSTRQHAPSAKRKHSAVSDDDESKPWEPTEPLSSPNPTRTHKISPLARHDSPLTDITLTPPSNNHCSLSATPPTESDCSVETLVNSPPLEDVSKEQKLLRMSESPSPLVLDAEMLQLEAPPAKKVRTIRSAAKKAAAAKAKPRTVQTRKLRSRI